jgi:hypothetical protein
MTSVPSEDQRWQVVRILWGGFLMSQLVFAGLFWFLHAQRSELGTPPMLLAYILAGIGSAAPLLAPVLSRALLSAAVRNGGLTRAKPVELIFVPAVIRFAVTEVGAIMAALVLMLFGAPLLWAVPAGLALAGHLTAFPSPQSFDLNAR